MHRTQKDRKHLESDKDLKRGRMEYDSMKYHDRHTEAAKRQMEHRPYQADFRDHIMSRFERVE